MSSCGLQANLGSSAEPNLRLVVGDAYKFLGRFRSRPINSELADRTDLMLAMEEGQVREILSRYPRVKGRVHTVTGFAGVKGEIDDFLDSERADFLGWLESCKAILEKCLCRVLERVVRGDF